MRFRRMLIAVPANLVALGLLYAAATDLIPGLGEVGRAMAQGLSSMASGISMSISLPLSFFSGLPSGLLSMSFASMSNVVSFSNGPGSLAVVPEPSTLAILITALAATSFVVMRLRQRRAARQAATPPTDQA